MKCCSKILPSYSTTYYPDSVVCDRCFEYAAHEQLDNEKSMYVTYSVEPYRTFSNKNTVRVLHVVDCTKSDEFRNIWVRVKKSDKIATINIDLPEFPSDDLNSCKVCDILNNTSSDSPIQHESTYETNTSDEIVFVNEQSNQAGLLSSKVNEQSSKAEELSEEANSTTQHSKKANYEKSYDIKDIENLKLPKCSVKLVKHDEADLHLYSFLSRSKQKKSTIPFTSASNLSGNDIKAGILSSSINIVLNKNLEEIIASSSKKTKISSKSSESKKIKDRKSSTDTKAIKKTPLKRKKSAEDLEQLSDESYEDDIFENNTVRIPDFLEDESDTEGSITGMDTPKFEYSVSPEEHSSSPVYEDCYSPAELNVLRKEAEQYNSKRKRRKMRSSLQKDSGLYEKMNKLSSGTLSSEDALNEVCRILSEKKFKEQSDDEEESEDNYFSDNSIGNLL